MTALAVGNIALIGARTASATARTEQRVVITLAICPRRAAGFNSPCLQAQSAWKAKHFKEWITHCMAAKRRSITPELRLRNRKPIQAEQRRRIQPAAQQLDKLSASRQIRRKQSSTEPIT